MNETLAIPRGTRESTLLLEIACFLKKRFKIFGATRMFNTVVGMFKSVEISENSHPKIYTIMKYLIYNENLKKWFTGFDWGMPSWDADQEKAKDLESLNDAEEFAWKWATCGELRIINIRG